MVIFEMFFMVYILSTVMILGFRSSDICLKNSLSRHARENSRARRVMQAAGLELRHHGGHIQAFGRPVLCESGVAGRVFPSPSASELRRPGETRRCRLAVAMAGKLYCSSRSHCRGAPGTGGRANRGDPASHNASGCSRRHPAGRGTR